MSEIFESSDDESALRPPPRYGSEQHHDDEESRGSEIFGSSDDESASRLPASYSRRSEQRPIRHSHFAPPLPFPANMTSTTTNDEVANHQLLLTIMKHAASTEFTIEQLKLQSTMEEERLQEIRYLRKNKPLYLEDHDFYYRCAQFPTLPTIDGEALLQHQTQFFTGCNNNSEEDDEQLLQQPLQLHIQPPREKQIVKREPKNPIAESLREQYTCCICLDLMYDPTTLPCGHSGCLTCLKQAFVGATVSRYQPICCPICKKKIPLTNPREQLEVSIILRNTLTSLFPNEYGKKTSMLPCVPAIDIDMITTLSILCKQYNMKLSAYDIQYRTAGPDYPTRLSTQRSAYGTRIQLLAYKATDNSTTTTVRPTFQWITNSDKHLFPICPSCNTIMIWSNDYSSEGYSDVGFCVCDLCRRRKSEYRWFCLSCNTDYCRNCHGYAIDMHESDDDGQKEARLYELYRGVSCDELHDEVQKEIQLNYSLYSQSLAYRIHKDNHYNLLLNYNRNNYNDSSNHRQDVVKAMIASKNDIDIHTNMSKALLSRVSNPENVISVEDQSDSQRYDRFVNFLTSQQYASDDIETFTAPEFDSIDAAMRRYLPNHQIAQILRGVGIPYEESTIYDAIRSKCWKDCLQRLLQRLSYRIHERQIQDEESKEEDEVNILGLIMVDDVLLANMHCLPGGTFHLPPRIYGFGYPGIPRGILAPTLMKIISTVDKGVGVKHGDEIALSMLQDMTISLTIDLLKTCLTFVKLHKVETIINDKTRMSESTGYRYERVELEEISLDDSNDKEESGRRKPKRSKTTTWKNEIYHKVSINTDNLPAKSTTGSSLMLITEETLQYAMNQRLFGELIVGSTSRRNVVKERFRKYYCDNNTNQCMKILDSELGVQCGLFAFSPLLILSLLQSLPEFNYYGILTMTVDALLILSGTIEYVAMEVIEAASKQANATSSPMITSNHIMTGVHEHNILYPLFSAGIYRHGGQREVVCGQSDQPDCEEAMNEATNGAETRWNNFKKRVYEQHKCELGPTISTTAGVSHIVDEDGDGKDVDEKGKIEKSRKQKSQYVFIDPFTGHFMSTVSFEESKFVMLPVIDALAKYTPPVPIEKPTIVGSPRGTTPNTANTIEGSSQEMLSMDNIFARKLHAIDTLSPDDRQEFLSFANSYWYIWKYRNEYVYRVGTIPTCNTLPVFDMEAIHALCVFGLEQEAANNDTFISYHLTFEACELIGCLIENYIFQRLKLCSHYFQVKDVMRYNDVQDSGDWLLGM